MDPETSVDDLTRMLLNQEGQASDEIDAPEAPEDMSVDDIASLLLQGGHNRESVSSDDAVEDGDSETGAEPHKPSGGSDAHHFMDDSSHYQDTELRGLMDDLMGVRGGPPKQPVFHRPTDDDASSDDNNSDASDELEMFKISVDDRRSIKGVPDGYWKLKVLMDAQEEQNQTGAVTDEQHSVGRQEPAGASVSMQDFLNATCEVCASEKSAMDHFCSECDKKTCTNCMKLVKTSFGMLLVCIQCLAQVKMIQQSKAKCPHCTLRVQQPGCKCTQCKRRSCEKCIDSYLLAVVGETEPRMLCVRCYEAVGKALNSQKKKQKKKDKGGGSLSKRKLKPRSRASSAGTPVKTSLSPRRKPEPRKPEGRKLRGSPIPERHARGKSGSFLGKKRASLSSSVAKPADLSNSAFPGVKLHVPTQQHAVLPESIAIRAKKTRGALPAGMTLERGSGDQSFMARFETSETLKFEMDIGSFFDNDAMSSQQRPKDARRGVVLFDFKASKEGQIPLKQGADVYAWHNAEEDNWTFGECGGVTGVFPLTYCSFDVESPEPEFPVGSALQYRAVGAADDATWLTGQVQNVVKEDGEFVYVIGLDDSDTIVNRTERDLRPVPRELMHGVCLVDFEGDPEKDQLSFKKGASCRILRQENWGWSWGEVDGNAGFFPSNSVRVLGKRFSSVLHAQRSPSVSEKRGARGLKIGGSRGKKRGEEEDTLQDLDKLLADSGVSVDDLAPLGEVGETDELFIDVQEEDSGVSVEGEEDNAEIPPGSAEHDVRPTMLCCAECENSFIVDASAQQQCARCSEPVCPSDKCSCVGVFAVLGTPEPVRVCATCSPDLDMQEPRASILAQRADSFDAAVYEVHMEQAAEEAKAKVALKNAAALQLQKQQQQQQQNEQRMSAYAAREARLAAERAAREEEEREAAIVARAAAALNLEEIKEEQPEEIQEDQIEEIQEDQVDEIKGDQLEEIQEEEDEEPPALPGPKPVQRYSTTVGGAPEIPGQKPNLRYSTTVGPSEAAPQRPASTLLARRLQEIGDQLDEEPEEEQEEEQQEHEEVDPDLDAAVDAAIEAALAEEAPPASPVKKPAPKKRRFEFIQPSKVEVTDDPVKMIASNHFQGVARYFQLSVQKGETVDVLTVIDETQPWILCENSLGNQGYLPRRLLAEPVAYSPNAAKQSEAALPFGRPTKSVIAARVPQKRSSNPMRSPSADKAPFNNSSQVVVAAFNDDVASLGQYIAQGCSVDSVVPATGNSALFAACGKGSVHAMRLLVDRGCNVNLANRKGNTPLHVLARKGRINAALWLIRQGANVDAKNLEGETPLSISDKLSAKVIAGAMLEDVELLEEEEEAESAPQDTSYRSQPVARTSYGHGNTATSLGTGSLSAIYADSLRPPSQNQ